MTSLPAFFVRMAAILAATVAVLALAVAMMGTRPAETSANARPTQVSDAGKP
jgi:hypothetical protein